MTVTLLVQKVAYIYAEKIFVLFFAQKHQVWKTTLTSFLGLM